MPDFSYEYENPVKSFTVDVAKIQPIEQVVLGFKKIEIRVHKDQDMYGFLYITIAIPPFESDYGIVWEKEFSMPIDEEDISSSFEINSFPANLIALGKIKSNLKFTLKFEEDKRLSKGTLTLNVILTGTPFFGYVLLDESMYSLQI